MTYAFSGDGMLLSTAIGQLIDLWAHISMTKPQSFCPFVLAVVLLLWLLMFVALECNKWQVKRRIPARSVYF